MINKTILVLAITAAFVAGISQEADAAIYIDFGDFPGEATKEPHVDWINVSKVTQSIERESYAVAKYSTRGLTFGDIVVEKEVDKSTPKLQEAIATGTVFDEVVINFTKILEDKEVTYLQWELKDVKISDYSFSGTALADSVPTDQVSINFKEIKVSYTTFDSSGNPLETVEFSWKVND